MSKTLEVGGQAVIEGVMMKSYTRVATAVRTEDGKIILNVDDFNSVLNKSKFYRLPFIRGVISLFELMFLGMKTLMWSANQQGEEDEQLSSTQLWLTVAFSLLFSVALFILLPYAMSYVIIAQQNVIFNLIDGLFRLLIFVAYLSGIGMMSDIHRIFQYHGAEHKTVNCYEAGDKLTAENVMKHSKLQARCGTSLLVFVLGLSIVLFSLLESPFWYVNLAWRLALVPVIAGISYEVIKASAKSKNKLLQLIIKPGLWTQELTAREPNKEQCEVAIKALKSVV